MEELKLSLKQEDNLNYKSERPKVQQKITVEESLARLSPYGGMRLLKSIIRNIENLDPQHKVARRIFLEDSVYADARKKLLEELLIWIDILDKEETDITELLDYCKEEYTKSQELQQENLAVIRYETLELEKVYRTLYSFFQNVGNPDKPVRCLSLINVNRKNISNITSEDGQIITKEIVRKYDNLDLRESYSLLVIPDFFHVPRDDERESPVNSVELRQWVKMVHDNKCLFLTDFEDCFSYEDLCTRLDRMSLQDSSIAYSNAVLICNHILARRKSDYEDDDFYIPSSAALAGRMTDTEKIVISQGIAGQRYGAIEKAYAVRFELMKSEIAYLMDKGVVPMIEVDGRVVAFSNNTLYAGKDVWFREYPIVRVFNWVNKVIQHFCNSEALILWDAMVRSEMENVLTRFLEQYKGHGKLYEDYILKQIVQDSKTKNIHVQIEIRPFYAMKNFQIELTGKNTKTNVEWEQSIVYLDK